MELKLAFLKRLEELTREFGIAIGSCGCCDSIFLVKIESDKGGYDYSIDDDGSIDSIKWISQQNKGGVMAKNWKQHDFNYTQKEVACVLGTSQQNVNDAERKALKKLEHEFLKIYTIDEIRFMMRMMQ